MSPMRSLRARVLEHFRALPIEVARAVTQAGSTARQRVRTSFTYMASAPNSARVMVVMPVRLRHRTDSVEPDRIENSCRAVSYPQIKRYAQLLTFCL